MSLATLYGETQDTYLTLIRPCPLRGVYTAQRISPLGAPSPKATNTDSASAGTPVPERPGAGSPGLPSPRPFPNP